MKNFKIVFVAMMMTFSIFGCMVTVDPGYEAVLTNKPLFFGHEGVVEAPVTPGRAWKFPTTDVTEKVDMRPIQYAENFSDVMSSDNIPVIFSAYMILNVKKGSSPELVDAYGTMTRVYTNNIQRVFRTETRRRVQQYSMTALTTKPEVMDSIGEVVTKNMQALIDDKLNGLVELRQVVISKAVPVPAVQKAIAETAKQQQMAKTQHERDIAEQARKKAEASAGKADRAYVQALGLSSDEYVRLRSIEANLKSAELCSEASNCTLILGATSGVALGIK